MPNTRNAEGGILVPKVKTVLNKEVGKRLNQEGKRFSVDYTDTDFDKNVFISGNTESLDGWGLLFTAAPPAAPEQNPPTHLFVAKVDVDKASADNDFTWVRFFGQRWSRILAMHVPAKLAVQSTGPVTKTSEVLGVLIEGKQEKGQKTMNRLVILD